jgi:hypothetical protein
LVDLALDPQGSRAFFCPDQPGKRQARAVLALLERGAAAPFEQALIILLL